MIWSGVHSHWRLQLTHTETACACVNTQVTSLLLTCKTLKLLRDTAANGEAQRLVRHLSYTGYAITPGLGSHWRDLVQSHKSA